MKIFRDLDGLSEFVNNHRKNNKSIGFVPTMGALHKGHISLISHSVVENNITIASVFVNPIQFTKQEDLLHYPRTEEQDIRFLKDAGCDALFIPSEEQMYPETPTLKISFGHLEEVMEGKFRPGHFNGVAIVVGKLLNYVNPDTAYFGQKDYQQLAIIKTLVKDLSFPVKIKSCPTIREEDGLAMSSRNVRLGEGARAIAPKIYRGLTLAAEMVRNGQIKEAKSGIVDYFNSFPQLELEYFEVSDAETLLPVVDIKNHKNIVLCIAVYLDNVRLIDNILLFS